MHNRGIEIEIKWRPTEGKQSNWNLIELTDGKACLPVFAARKLPQLGVELLLVVIVVALAEGLCRLSGHRPHTTATAVSPSPSKPTADSPPCSAVVGVSDGESRLFR
ncbi:hypothetical protein Dimus_032442 [Dionaea muscipula]